MCTIVLSTDTKNPTSPWMVAANRDEKLARPSAPPSIIDEPTGRILTPRDLVYNGTWIGVNDRGLLVAITNRDDTPEQHGTRSRGLLVLDALRETSAEAVTRLAMKTAANYKHFHLVAADARKAYAVVRGQEALFWHALHPGFHVVTEQSFDAGQDRRGKWIRSCLASKSTPSAFNVPDAVDLLGRHFPGDPFNSPCVHTIHESRSYGTRSFFFGRFEMRKGKPAVSWTSAEGSTCQMSHLSCQDFEITASLKEASQ